MPLDRDQFKACFDILLPHVNTTPDDRRALVDRALHGSAVINSIDWTGNPRTFATNLVRQLERFDDVTSLVILLETLRDEVGEPTVSAITALIANLAPPPAPAAKPGSVPATSVGTDVFISYSRHDFTFVDRLRADLVAHHIPYWIDKEGLPPGTSDWERSIRAAIQHSKAVVWVVSPAAFESEYVKSELAVAKMYERTIYPVWADGDNWVACVPFGMHSIQYVDMRGAAYSSGLAQLIAALRGEGDVPPVPPESTGSLTPGHTPVNPYKGLFAFEEEDADLFFGREALVARLADLLKTRLDGGQARFLAVLGPSGAGKSSVVMAGMLPALKRGEVPGSGGWTYLPRMVPGQHPIEHLADALKVRMPDTALTAIETDLNAPGGRMLHRLANHLPGEQVVLYVDQFEELFALTQDESERQQFINLITHAATEPGGKLIVLLTMRADFLDRPLNYPALGDLFNAHTELVRPMSIAELRDAIEKPARLSGLTFDSGLVAEIVFALRARDQALAGALPLLQFALERLYEERDGTRLTWDAYQAMGGVDGAIGTHCETVFCALPESTRNQLGRVFLPLVNIDDDTGEPTRRRAPLDSLSADPDAQALIDALVENRLLQAGRDGATAYLEIAHEALFRSWTRLAEWIAATRGDLFLLKELRKAARAWDEHDRDRDYLWLGERGQDAQGMLGRLEPDLDDVERAFARPEHEHLLDEIADIETLHPRRSEISTRLHQLKHTLPGAGLRPDGLPDIEWCYVDVPEDLRGTKIEFVSDEGKFGDFEIEPFDIARYLVTYAQFQAFVKQDYENPQWWRDMPKDYQRQAVTEAQQPYTNYPRDNVSWYQAVAFCRWLSAALGDQVTLPTEQQWQWAAQNGLEHREYPWGDWDGQRCNTSEAGVGRSTAVGMYPHGAADCGALDMSGNLWEWCLDKYGEPEDWAIDDSGASRVLRGGSWYVDQGSARAVYRDGNLPGYRNSFIGCRVVRVPHL